MMIFPVENVKADIIYVDVGGGAEYTKIQDAINVASDGDTIYVFNGTYYENIVINRYNLKLIGENKKGTIIDANGSGIGIQISNDMISVIGFTVRNAGSDDVFINGRSNNYISDCKIYNSSADGVLFHPHGYYNIIEKCEIYDNQNNGVRLNAYGGYIENNQIIDSKIYSNSYYGVEIAGSYYSNNNNVISRCECYNNSLGGIKAIEGPLNYNYFLNTQCHNNGGDGLYTNGKNNKIINCSFENNSGIGINLYDADNILLENTDVQNNVDCGCKIKYMEQFNILNSTFNNNLYGIKVDTSSGAYITNCTTNNNVWEGILLDSSNSINVKNSISNNNYNGIDLVDNAYNNNIIGCRFSGNSYYGIHTIQSNNNIIYNNYLNNANNAYELLSSAGNQWNIEKTPGKNIIDGPNLGGNYWSNFDEPSEGAYDNNSDGLVDSPKSIPGGGSLDQNPLIELSIIPPDMTYMGLMSSEKAYVLGEDFNITVYIDPTEAIGGWQIYQLNFTQGIVNAKQVTLGPYWTEFFDEGVIDNETGTITNIQTWTDEQFPSNNHTACTISFEALQPGICSFELVNVDILDSEFNEMNYSTRNTSVTIVEQPVISNEYPADGSIVISKPPTNLSAYVSGSDLDVFFYFYNMTPIVDIWTEISSWLGVSEGRYEFSDFESMGNNWIWGDTTYNWRVSIYNGYVWTNKTFDYTTTGNRYDVNNNDNVNFQDAGLVWVHRTSRVAYDGVYDVNDDGLVNFQDAGLTWFNRD